MRIEWDNEDVALDSRTVTGMRLSLPLGDKADVEVLRGMVRVQSKYTGGTLCELPVRDLFVVTEYVMDMLDE